MGEPEQLLDVEAFCSHVSDMEMKCKIDVEDENEIVAGDIATVSVTLTRKNLQEGEAAGPVHAPFFPEPKFEEWWVFLLEANQTSTRIIAFEKIKDTERVVEEKLRFQVSRVGPHNLQVQAICDSYAGLDQKEEIKFTAKSDEEAKRQIFVHPEDEDLDLQPTLFQQFMGELNREEESEEEEEDDNKPKKVANSKKPQAQAVREKDAPVAKDEESSDSDEEDNKKKEDDSSSSSSDSD